MSLKSIPVDTTRMQFIAVDVQEVPDYAADGTRNGQQRADQDGRLLFRVNVLAIVEGEPGGETVAIRVPFDGQPNIAPLTPIKFSDLMARPWAQGDRSGIALVASGVETDGHNNGRGRKSDPLAPAQEVAA